MGVVGVQEVQQWLQPKWINFIQTYIIERMKYDYYTTKTTVETYILYYIVHIAIDLIMINVSNN